MKGPTVTKYLVLNLASMKYFSKTNGGVDDINEAHRFNEEPALELTRDANQTAALLALIPMQELDTPIPYESYADVMTAEEWLDEGCCGCMFLPSDGCGYWGNDEGSFYEYSCFDPKPEWATKVAWYNN